MDISDSQTLTYHLQVGVLELTPGWHSMLTQIGIAYETADLDAPDLVQRYSVIIVNEKLNPSKFQIINAYLDRGGSILDTGPYAKYAEHKSLAKKYAGQILPDPKGPFAHVGRIDLHQNIVTDESGNYLSQTVTMPTNNTSNVAFLGWNIDQAISNTRSLRKTFVTDNKELRPNEIVSKISKAPIRRVITTLLKSLHFARNLPFVQLWPIPSGYKHFFGFRIDSDNGTKNTLDVLKQFAGKHKLRMSWFLHVEAHKDWLQYFQSLQESHEIACHGYDHQTFRSFRRNYQNMQRANELLSRSDLEARGFCAPYGLWNQNLQRAVEKAGFSYSSEFAFDHDNLPSYPIVDGQFSKSLQIPIHPMGTGRLKHAGASSQQMESYFKQVIDLQFSRHEPVFLYHHPNQSGLKIFSNVMDKIENLNYCNWTMGAYADWWKTRAHLQFTPKFRNHKIWFNPSTQNSSIHAAIFKSEDKFSIQNLEVPVHTKQINYNTYSPKTPPSVTNQYRESYYRWPLIKSSMLDFIHRHNF